MGVATNAGIFCGGRVLIGFGTAMANTVAPTLLQEIAHPRYRAQVGGCCKLQRVVYVHEVR